MKTKQEQKTQVVEVEVPETVREQIKHEARVAVAKLGARARWGDESTPRAVAGEAEKPLRVGGIEISCYVLNDGRRVFTQSGLQQALGLSTGGGKGGLRRLPGLLGGFWKKGIETAALALRADKPFLFFTNDGKTTALGYEATLLTDICTVVLDARAAGVLAPNQQRMAAQCEILVKGFSRIGVIAVVDEHTGYQEIRARDALAKSLDAYIAEELQRWVRVFPPAFYREMFRLRGWVFDAKSNMRPRIVGKYTNDLVYNRLAPGVLEELQQKNPVSEEGHRAHRHHQWFTPDMGSPMLQKHIIRVTSYMECSETWGQFMATLDRLIPVRDLASLKAEADAVALAAAGEDAA